MTQKFTLILDYVNSLLNNQAQINKVVRKTIYYFHPTQFTMDNPEFGNPTMTF